MPGAHSPEVVARGLLLELPADPRLVELRERLERARESGEPFPSAWAAATAAVMAPLEPRAGRVAELRPRRHDASVGARLRALCPAPA